VRANYLAQDALGSTRLLTDSSGTVEGTTSYNPYEQVTAQSGTETTPFGFAGQYTDSRPVPCICGRGGMFRGRASF
jgi:hypothetical protein